MTNANTVHFESKDDDINFDDIPEITDFSGFKKSPRIAKFIANVKAAGRYYTRAFDYKRGTVEIREIEAGTHKVLSIKVVAIDEVSQGEIGARTEKIAIL